MSGQYLNQGIARGSAERGDMHLGGPTRENLSAVHCECVEHLRMLGGKLYEINSRLNGPSPCEAENRDNGSKPLMHSAMELRSLAMLFNKLAVDILGGL